VGIVIEVGPGDETQKAAWAAMMTMPGNGTLPDNGIRKICDGTHKAVVNKSATDDRTHSEVAKVVDVASPQESDNWTGREDTIRAQGATSSAALALDSHYGTAAPLGTNASNVIAVSPPVQLYIRAAAMASHWEAISRVIGNIGSNAVIDLFQDCDVVQKKIKCKGLIEDTSSPFADVNNR
jgi:hypothetical protein